jgi:hypothetical protein
VNSTADEQDLISHLRGGGAEDDPSLPNCCGDGSSQTEVLIAMAVNGSNVIASYKE